MFKKGPFLLQHFVKTSLGQQGPTFPWMTSDFANLSNSPFGNVVPGNQLGGAWFDSFGNGFTLKLLRASALAVGDTTQWGTTAAGGGLVTDTATAASTVRVITLTNAGQTAGAEVNNFVYDEVISRTGTPTTDGLKLIKANTASTLTVSVVDTKASNQQNDPDAYATAPANLDALTIIRPYQTIIFPAAASGTGMVAGIAVSAVTQNSWHFEQISGLAMVHSLGDGTALVINQPAVPSGATAGAVIGAAATAANQVGISAASKATATGLSPVFLTTPFFAS